MRETGAVINSAIVRAAVEGVLRAMTATYSSAVAFVSSSQRVGQKAF